MKDHAAWTEHQWQGHSVHVFLPEPWSAVALYLHPLGLEMPRDDEFFTQLLAKEKLACVAPCTGPTWYTDRKTARFDDQVSVEEYLHREVLSQTRTLFALPDHYPVCLFGISMGGQGALRLGFRYPKLFPIVAGISSALEYDQLYGKETILEALYPSREACRQDTAILQLQPHLVPRHIYFACDPEDHLWYRGNDRLAEKLSALGIPHDQDLETSHGGHRWTYFHHQLPGTLSWLIEKSKKERSRLL